MLYMHCYFTQGDRKAFKTTPAENIYATLSEVREDGHILLHSFLDGAPTDLCLVQISVTVVYHQHSCNILSALLPSRASILLLGQTPHSLRKVLSTGVLPQTLRASTSS